MTHIFIKLKIVLLLYLLPVLCFGQISNRGQEQNLYKKNLQNNALYLSLYSNSFFDNKEYFLNTVSGYTLFGTQNIFALTYKPHPIVTLRGGIYLKKDFGTDGFVKTAPYFNLTLAKNGYSLAFGNFKGNIGHRMLNPIFAYERLSTDFLENGIQLKVDKSKIYSETWIDWRKQQYYNANYNEEFTVGHHTSLRVFKKGGTTFSVPVQALAHHSGGQLDTTDANTVTLLNAAIGLDFKQKIAHNKILKSFGANAYYVVYKDLANNSGLPFSKGSGIYANVNLRFQKGFYANVGYWQSNQFIAPSGGRLFQSLSYNPQSPNTVDSNRKMLLVGLAYQKNIIKNLNLDVRLEPFYDFGNKKLNYSYALFLTYQPDFLLKRFKKIEVQ